MVPPEKLASVTTCKPPACRRCRRPLEGDDPVPLIHQVAQWPVVQPTVHEYRHRLRCPGCGETTCGTPPPGVSAGAFGPRLQAMLSLLAGAYRLSERQVQQLARDLLGLRIAVGMIAKLERHSIGLGGVSEPIGRELLDASDRLFHRWHRVRDGTLERPTFGRLVGRVRAKIGAALARGRRYGSGRTAGTCTELRKVEPASRSFVRVPGGEPTKNTAEGGPASRRDLASGQWRDRQPGR